jgi:hypothetical protein
VAIADSDTLTFALEALDASVSAPLAVPADFGAKETESVRLSPAARVCEVVKPLRLNPAPVTVAEEIVTLEPPELVTVSYSIWLLATWILPKFMLEGLAARKPGGAGVPEIGAVPVPVKELVLALKRCLLRFQVRVEVTTDKLPLAPPTDCGVKVTGKRTLCPGATVIGKFGPV